MPPHDVKSQQATESGEPSSINRNEGKEQRRIR
jgi:hypothetical protein